MTFIKGHSTSTPVPSISADIYWAGSLLTKIVMIMFTQSTAVLQNYLNGELLCLLQFFPREHRIPGVFHVQRNPRVFQVFQVCAHPELVQDGSAIGADFHGAIMATAPGEKLLIGRRPVRSWTRCMISSLFLCGK